MNHDFRFFEGAVYALLMSVPVWIALGAAVWLFGR